MALKWSSMSVMSRSILLVSLLQALVVIALEIVVSVLFIREVNVTSNDKEEGSGRSITVYLSIFLFTQIYQFIIILDAVWNQNTIQVFAHLFYCACMVGFALFQYFQIKEALSSLPNGLATFDTIYPLLLASVAVLFVCTVLFAYLSFKLYLEFGWRIYKKIGADPRKREMFRSYQVLIMLLKFDLYFFLAYAIQYLALVLRKTDPEFGLTIVAIFASFGVVALVVYGLRTENKIITISWILFSLLIMAYFAFKVGRIYDPSEAYKYVGSGKFLTLFASLGFVVTVITFSFSIICYLNFGKGLKEHLTKSKSSSTVEEMVGDKGNGRTMVLA